MGQVVSARNVHTVRFPIICGSANNQLIQDNYAEILQRNGVFYVPDYLANSGGVINVAKAHPVVPGSSIYRGGGRNLKRGWVSSFRVL
jgi:glutamate dehydrogenase/leucine dehydrogenase